MAEPTPKSSRIMSHEFYRCAFRVRYFLEVCQLFALGVWYFFLTDTHCVFSLIPYFVLFRITVFTRLNAARLGSFPGFSIGFSIGYDCMERRALRFCVVTTRVELSTLGVPLKAWAIATSLELINFTLRFRCWISLSVAVPKSEDMTLPIPF